MLSVLIPEHNYNCTKLVNDLAAQCTQAGIVFEILVLDDASTLYKTENRMISDIPGCQFIESEQNLGSARCRNRLAEMAQYPHLLMIDSDAEVGDDFFIARYIEAMNNAQVIVGSMCYSEQKPPKDRCLRWYYGKKRENRPAFVRNKAPYQSLISFNFMADKNVMLKHPFEEQFESNYGHDDSMFGFTLKQSSIKIRHIDNLLVHNGLDSNEIFLSKSLKAAEKYFTYPIFQSKEMLKLIKIFRVFSYVQKWGLCPLLALKFRLGKKLMERNLYGKHPLLFVFDLYRLGYMCDYQCRIK